MSKNSTHSEELCRGQMDLWSWDGIEYFEEHTTLEFNCVVRYYVDHGRHGNWH